MEQPPVGLPDSHVTSPPSFYFERAVNKRESEPQRARAHKLSTTELRTLPSEKTQTFPLLLLSTVLNEI